MIPKIIHYCWFGNTPLPDEALKCINSWRKFCPDYKIIEWNESNYDINKIPYVKEAYSEKKFAFVTDVARLDIIYNEGGLYLDTDVEILKSFDDLLVHKAFMGMETIGRVNTGLGFGAERHNSFVKSNLDLYNKVIFGDMMTCVSYTTKLLVDLGLQKINELQIIDELVILPTDYLCPLSLESMKLNITNNTYSIHHYDMSWKDKRDYFLKLKIKTRRWIGNDNYEFVKKYLKGINRSKNRNIQ